MRGTLRNNLIRKLRKWYVSLMLKKTFKFRNISKLINDYYNAIIRTLDKIIYYNLSIGKRRRHIKRKKVSLGDIKKLLDTYKEMDEEFMEFYEIYDISYDGSINAKKINVDVNLDELLEQSYMNMLTEYTMNLSYFITTNKYLPSKIDFQYVGISDINKYFLKVILISVAVGLLFILNNIIDNNITLQGILSGLFYSIIIFLGGIFYPKIKLILFRGETKLQIIVTILDMISSLNSGMSLQEAMKNISENPEYGIPSFEFKSILYDIHRGGYSFKEALERAKLRTKIPLMKKLYDQIIISVDSGGTQLLLKSLYSDIIRESMSKIDSSKFQISNLGNLLFGVGMILPFSGMMLSSIQGNMGFEGIINTIGLVLTKMAPLVTAIFAIFIKLKIE